MSSPVASTDRNPDDFIEVGRAVKVESLKVHRDHLEIAYTLDGTHNFLTKVLYPAGTLAAFRKKYEGTDFAHRIFCHIALIEALKFIATFPRTLDISVIASGLSQSSLDFFTLAASRAWSQHFYENEVHGYHGPSFVGAEGLVSAVPIAQEHSAGEVGGGILCANGGGKDSFLALKLLEECEFPVHVFQHARTEYGRFDHQHAIQKKFHPHISALKSGRATVHEISVMDDFTDGSLMGLLNPQLRGDAIKGYPCQVGWPEMVFEALPFMLLNNYSGFCLGNERSADSAQVTNSSLDGDREVNHQWLKSFEACAALRKFLQASLVKDIEVFSILKPLHDYRIYQLLKRYPQVLPDIHSCNILKPWCKRCSKCAYVWVNLVAIFGYAAVFQVFQENLWDVPELQHSWRELLGLGEHNAFECVGEVDETRLAFERAEKDGGQGKAMDVFKKNFVPKGTEPTGTQVAVDYEALRAKFNRVYDFDHGVPEWIFKKVQANMERD
jgi:hypothetical protein